MIKVGNNRQSTSMNEANNQNTIRAGGYQFSVDDSDKPIEIYCSVGNKDYRAESNDGKKWLIYIGDKRVGQEILLTKDYQAVAIIMVSKYIGGTI